MLRIKSLKIVPALLLFLVASPFYSICQDHNFVLKVHLDNPNIKTLIIGEAYWRTIKPYHAAKIEIDSSTVHENTFLFKGTTLYPTAVRLFSNIDSIKFNELIFIDTGYQEVRIIKKNGSYIIRSNTAIEKQYKEFLNKMNSKTIDEKLQGEKLLSFVQKNPDSYIALFAVINQAFRYPYPSIFNKINASFGKKITQTKAFQYYENRYNPKTVGPVDSNLLGTSIDGKKITLSAFKGKSYVILDFWATWCMPCLQMMPHLKNLYQKYHSKGLEIISISSSLNDNKNTWKKIVRKDSMQSWINLFSEAPYNNGPDLGIKYGVTELPTIILINKKGTIIGRYTGYSDDGSESELDKKLNETFR